MFKSMLSFSAVCIVSAGFAAESGDYEENGCRYYLDEAGVSHQYLWVDAFKANQNWSSWDKGPTFRSAFGATDTVNWESGSIYVSAYACRGGLQTYTGVSLYGMQIDAPWDGLFLHPQSAGANQGKFVFGSKGVSASVGVKLEVWDKGANLHLAGSQTWSGPDRERSAEYSDQFRIRLGTADGKYNGSVSALSDGLTWTIAGDTYMSIQYPTNSLPTTHVVIRHPAILRLEPVTVDGVQEFGRLGAASLTLDGGDGLYLGTENFVIGGVAVQSPPTVTPARYAGKIVLKDGGVLTAKEAATWEGVSLEASGTGGSLVGTYVFRDTAVTFKIASGATLDVSGADTSLSSAADVSGALTVSGPGTFRYRRSKLSFPAGISFEDDVKLEIAEAGILKSPLDGIAGLIIAADGDVYVPADVWQSYEGGDIEVRSGALVLDSADVLPEGIKIVTSGDGALVLGDTAGFNADEVMGGTKNVDDSLVVRSETPGDAAVSVGSGKALRVFGSGLGPTGSVSLADGAAIVFYASATISAPVVQGGTVDIRTAANSVTGTLSGAWSCTAGAACECRVYSPGEVVFAMGGTFGNGYSTLTLCEGHAALTEPTVFSTSSPRLRSGLFRVCGNGRISYGQTQWIAPGLDRTDMTGDAVLEIDSSAENPLEMGNNCHLTVGSGSSRYKSVLRLTSGTIFLTTRDRFYVSASGVFEMNGGTLHTARRITLEGGKVIWNGGMWWGISGADYRYNYLIEDTGGGELIVNGDFDLRLETARNAEITNFCNSVATMVLGPKARLAVWCSGDDALPRPRTFVIRNLSPESVGALDQRALYSNAGDVKIIGTGDDIVLGWVQGGSSCSVSCVGVPSRLRMNYFVPDGKIFENKNLDITGTIGLEGFTSVITNDLTFGENTSYIFNPVGGGIEPLMLSGSLALPAAMNYGFEPAAGNGAYGVLLTAAGGISGDCVWTCSGGAPSRKAFIAVDGNNLVLDKDDVGFVLTVR